MDAPTASASGAAKFLTDLPSRGLFSSGTISSNLGGLRVYVCDHDTEPPEEQLITTNKTNILIRSLTSLKNKGDYSKSPSQDTPRKRTSENSLEGRSKRTVTSSQSSSRHGSEVRCLHERIP